MSLSNTFLDSIIARLDSPNVIGISCTGSYARGQAGPYSDVDLTIYVHVLPEREYDRYTLRRWDGKLVSLHFNTLEAERTNLSHPEHALWAVPGLRQAILILDKDGSLADLQQAAVQFNWSALQPLADEYAIEQLMGCAEEVHKILNGLARGHESTVLYAVWGVFKGLASSVAVQRGLLMEPENLYFDLLQESVGRDTEWTRVFRVALAADIGPADVPPFRTRGAAVLGLYRETTMLFDRLITDQHRNVIVGTNQLIEQAGYSA